MAIRAERQTPKAIKAKIVVCTNSHVRRTFDLAIFIIGYKSRKLIRIQGYYSQNPVQKRYAQKLSICANTRKTHKTYNNIKNWLSVDRIHDK